MTPLTPLLQKVDCRRNDKISASHFYRENLGLLAILSSFSCQFWILGPFFLWALSTPSSHGTVNSTTYASLVVVDHRTVSGLIVVGVVSEGNNFIFPQVHIHFPIPNSVWDTCIYWSYLALWRLACWYTPCDVDILCWCLWDSIQYVVIHLKIDVSSLGT